MPLFGQNSGFDSVELVSLDVVQQALDFGSRVDYGISIMLDKALHDGVLLFVTVDVSLEVPPVSLSVVHGVLALVFRKRCHIVGIVWSEEVLVEVEVRHPPITCMLRRLHVHPARLPCDF